MLIYDSPKTYDMTGNQFVVVPKYSKDAVAFLNTLNAADYQFGC
jgi:hypothetical protein